jgi:hypothetical protein
MRAHPPRPVMAIAILGLALAVAACSSGGSPAASSGTSAAASATSAASTDTGSSDTAEPTPGTALTACQLVTPEDIETVLALASGTVSEGTLQQQPTVLDPATNECAYRDDSWGGLIVHVTPTDGVNTYDALVTAFGDDAETIAVGDGALWFENNDRGYFLKGSVLVLLQLTFLADGTPFRDPTVAIGQAAIAKI